MKDSLVTLRALEPDDVDYLYAWENDPEIWRVSATLAPFSRHSLLEYIADSLTKDVFEMHQVRLVIVENISGSPVGVIDLYDVAVPDMRASVGISINDKTRRRNGLAASALRLLTEYAFDILGLHQLHARISTGNVASRQLFTKCGFTESGVLRQWHRTAGGWEDQVEMQLIDEK